MTDTSEFTAPVVAETAPVVAETAPVVAEAAPVVAPVVAETAPVVAADPDDGTIPDTLRPYIEKLRKEAGDRRVALDPFEAAFTGYEADQREAFLTLAQNLASDDPAVQRTAAEFMNELAKGIIGDGSIDPDAPLTRADLERIETERATAAQTESEIQKVVSEVKALGYEEKTAAYANVLWRAQFETGGDIAKAHAAVQAEKQATIDEFVTSVNAGQAKWPVRPTPGAAPADPSGGSQAAPKTIADAGARARARQAAVQEGLRTITG